MSKTLELPSIEITRSSIDPDVWLAEQTLTSPAVPLMWEGHTVITSPEHLAVILSTLRPGGFGLVHWQGFEPTLWSQTMRVDENRWIVEASEGTSDGFVKRVYRDATGGYPQRQDSDHQLHDCERFNSYAAAAVMWSWAHGVLPEGLSRTLNFLSPSERQKLGLND